MHSILIIFYVLATFSLTNLFLIVNVIRYSDRHDYDICIASTDYFVVLTQNNALLYEVSMAPFGTEYACSYNYNTSNDFVINIVVGRQQNSS